MKPGLSLKQTWTALILFAVIVPVTIMMIWYGQNSYHNQLNSTLMIERQANESLRNLIESELKRFKTLLKNKSDTISFLLDKTGSPDALRDINTLLGLIVGREGAIREVMVLSKQGDVIAAVDPSIDVMGDKLLSAEELQLMAVHMGFDKTHEYPEVVIPLLGRDYLGSARPHKNHIVFNMAIPIGNPAKAVLVALIEVEKLWLIDGHKEHGIGLEKTRDYILDRRGALITDIRGSDYKPGDIMTHMAIARTALVNGETPAESSYIGVINQPVFGALTPIPSLDWALISEVIVSEITQPIWISLFKIMLITLFGVVIFVWFTLYLAGKTLRPLQHACEAIDRVAKGDYAFVLRPCGIRELDTMTTGFNDMVQARQDAETLLREREQNLAITLNSIGDAVITTDAKGHVTRINPAAEQITGWSLPEARGKALKTIFPIIDATTRKPIENPIEKVIATGNTIFISNHTTLIAKDGTEHQIADSAAPIRDGDGDIQGMVLVFSDITEQYQLRQAAAKNKRDLQAIMDHSPAIIYVKDTESHFTFVNKKFEQLFHRQREDIIGKSLYDIFPQDIADEMKHNDQAVLTAGHALESEEVAPQDDGLHTYMSIKFPLFDDNGNIYAVCGISTDITERQQTEEALRRAHKMEAIGHLSGGIAHDFNNQLGVIIGYLDFLQDYTANDDKAHRWVDTATRAALRCMDLTRQLLAFSRRQGKEKTAVDINATLMEMKTMITRSVTPEVEVQTLLSDSLWLTEINAGEFQDAILNLVINARDAMSNGGRLLLETSNTYLDADYAALNPGLEAGDYIQLMLSDTGTGMDKEVQEHIFEPFFTTKPEGKGTGLGMAMVYGFVKRYGGHIKVYSEPGMGTTIRLYLPRSKAAVTTIMVNNDQVVDLPTGNESILIVDDEADLLQLGGQYLTDLGYHIHLAENAAQALDILAGDVDIDLLFSDVVMPGGMNGYELAQRATQQRPGLQVLLTSGFTAKTITTNGLTRFSAHLLGKPYRKVDLAQRIRLVLDKESVA